MMRTGFWPFFAALMDILFPPRCLACGAMPTGDAPPRFCPTCLDAVRFLTSPLCTCCGRPLPDSAPGDHLCSLCLTGTFHFSRARSVLIYSEPAAKALYGLKYGGNRAGLTTFAALFASSPARLDLTADPDWILPVPLHGTRLRERGFNQSLLLAQAFFPALKKRIRYDLLERTRPTQSQTGLDRIERRHNVKKAFAVKEGATIAGKGIVLVDDVFTTGATVNECGRELMRAGAAAVEVVTLIRVELGKQGKVPSGILSTAGP